MEMGLCQIYRFQPLKLKMIKANLEHESAETNNSFAETS